MNKLRMSLGAIYLALKKKETPLWLKLATIGTVIYILSPVDLIPDIPIIGYLDDVTLLSFLIVLLQKGIPEDILEKSRQEFQKQKNKYTKQAQKTVNENIIDYDEILQARQRKSPPSD